jgi:ABC-type enterochelin transport system permease subunit
LVVAEAVVVAQLHPTPTLVVRAVARVVYSSSLFTWLLERTQSTLVLVVLVALLRLLERVVQRPLLQTS